MAIITAATNVPFDMSRTAFASLQSPVLNLVDPENVTFSYANGLAVYAAGSDLVQSSDGDFVSGTIQYLEESRDGQNLYTVSDFSLPISIISDLIVYHNYQVLIDYFNSGSQTITGSEKNDHLISFSAADIIYGGGGDDKIKGGAGNDFINGGSGSDIIYGQDGDDEIYGLEGDDLLFGGSGRDVINGGVGFDTAHYSLSSTRVIVDLEIPVLNFGDAFGDSLTSVELVGGSNLSDSLRGDATGNTLIGQYGDDFLDGRSGDDGLIGGEGNDFLIGGDGIDALYGGNGSDIFHYRSITESDYREIIGDFQTAMDVLQLVRSGYGDQLNLGELDPNRFVVGEGPTQGFGQFIYNSANNLFWDADGIGIGQAISLLTFAEHVPLLFSDIVIV